MTQIDLILAEMDQKTTRWVKITKKSYFYIKVFEFSCPKSAIEYFYIYARKMSKVHHLISEKFEFSRYLKEIVNAS